MGVPSLFRWVAKKYPDCIYNVGQEEVDNLYLDLNGIIHPCCHPTNKEAPTTEDGMFREIYKTIDHLVNIVKPLQLLYIAVDGVAPRAKMNQQRERRFKASDEALAKQEESGIVSEKGFDSNTITPGTPFMFRLHQSIISYIEERMACGVGAWHKLAVIYSGCDVPGEGEHKIYNFVRAIKGTGVRHAICGLDADLIFLSLATHEQSFKVLREDVFWIEKEERSRCDHCRASGHSAGNCIPPEFPPYIYLDIEILRRYLGKEFTRAVQMGADFERMLDDWVFMCFFVGNDFLPCIPSMDIKVNAIETITEVYIKELLTRHKYLTENARINIAELINLMDILGRSESQLLQVKYNRYISMTKRRGETPRPEDVQVRLFEEEGRALYYKRKLKAETPAQIQQACLEYVRGLEWVLQYYHHGCPSWGWYYPMHFAPLAVDIAQALRANQNITFGFNLGLPKRPLEQIMAVLPPSSADSVPKGMHQIFEDSPENYPTKIEVDRFGKTAAWQGVVLLPFLDYEQLVLRVRQHALNLPPEEIYRNVPGQDILILPLTNKCYSAAENLYANFAKAAGIKILNKYYSGKIYINTHSNLPGTKGFLKEESKEYTTRSISTLFKPTSLNN
ncbi:hypothetical protein NEHOM01_1308 [Nematocida homosporus]|uniref:uncharacterized protein n=1 Tax=Nematocida homosporus TaxID=1912981 RepID=UPI00221FF752|nr:uncharacterized protein NEHOM01_1308 [Nematocida homosporus]KAI5186143.1 hypothetical protein NEHOM01_1308 [Nematocida homosporus]